MDIVCHALQDLLPATINVNAQLVQQLSMESVLRNVNQVNLLMQTAIVTTAQSTRLPKTENVNVEMNIKGMEEDVNLLVQMEDT